MINIVSLKWGTLYDSSYVNKLFASVKRNTTLPFNFYCFTEDSTGIHPEVKIIPLRFRLDGWWNKLYLFSEEQPIKGRMFFIDLDTVITGSLDQLLSHNTGFIVLRDFFCGIARGVDDNSMGSGLMSWNSGDHTEIWTEFIKNPRSAVKSLHPHGDQRWIQKFVPERQYWQDLYPNQVVSFKVHCNNGLPPDARVICYHGKPNIPQSISEHTTVPHFKLKPAPWIADYWKE